MPSRGRKDWSTPEHDVPGFDFTFEFSGRMLAAPQHGPPVAQLHRLDSERAFLPRRLDFYPTLLTRPC